MRRLLMIEDHITWHVASMATSGPFEQGSHFNVAGPGIERVEGAGLLWIYRRFLAGHNRFLRARAGCFNPYRGGTKLDRLDFNFVTECFAGQHFFDLWQADGATVRGELWLISGLVLSYFLQLKVRWKIQLQSDALVRCGAIVL